MSARRQIAIYLRPGGFQGHSYREAKYLDTDSAYRLADWPGFVEAAKQALIQRIYGSHSVSYDDLIIGYFEHCQEFHIPFDQDLSELWTQANMCIADRRDDHRASR
ncbi:hypothetical protein COY07_05225 [Candidatus Peregrinibacteria bacterium CG_4_10_14_0_2_um_filter_43_11]|nr:MAG: hypothetical protein COY07_05225 [Candidatus Peregrinibacteria bacterium CG_4_10_14_0_2_um_filter_43_11]